MYVLHTFFDSQTQQNQKIHQIKYLVQFFFSDFMIFAGMSDFEFVAVNEEIEDTNSDEIEVVCKICDQIFEDNASYQSHHRTFHKELRLHGSFSCKFCQKVFTQRSNLQTHVKNIHDLARKFTCLTCGKSYKEKRNLQLHLKSVHTGQRDFKCNVCGKCFTQKHVLLRHLQSIHKCKSNSFEAAIMADI